MLAAACCILLLDDDSNDGAWQIQGVSYYCFCLCVCVQIYFLDDRPTGKASKVCSESLKFALCVC